MNLFESLPFKKIAIHSVPRSGSTWLGQIFNSHPNVAYRYQPLFSYAYKGRLSENSNISDINQFYNDLMVTRDNFVLQTNGGSLYKRNPVFSKNSRPTHLAYKEVRYNHILENLLKKDKNIFVVGLIRNPMAVINSWQNSPKEFRKDLGWDFLKEWRIGESKNLGRKEEFFGFDKWKEVAKLFIFLKNKYPDNFYLVRYSDLIANPQQEISKLFSFTKLKMTNSTINFLIESRSKNENDTYGVYKNHKNDDSYKNTLDKRIIAEIESELYNSELEQFVMQL